MTTSTTATRTGLPQPPDTATEPASGAPAHAPSIRTLKRLLPFARPALPALIGSALTATLAMMCGLAFPHVIQLVIDGPVAERDTQ